MTADAALNDKIVRMLVLTLDEPIADHIKKRAEERERLAEESRQASLAAGWGADDRPRRRRDDEDGGEVFEVPDVPELAEET